MDELDRAEDMEAQITALDDAMGQAGARRAVGAPRVASTGGTAVAVGSGWDRYNSMYISTLGYRGDGVLEYIGG